MRIIKRGSVPEEAIINSTCSNCKTEFEYTLSEAKLSGIVRGICYYNIACPVCSGMVEYPSRMPRYPANWYLNH